MTASAGRLREWWPGGAQAQPRTAIDTAETTAENRDRHVAETTAANDDNRKRRQPQTGPAGR
jgi:hypothetical protein